MVRLRHVRFASAVLVLVVLAGMAMLPASYALARQESGEPVTLRVWDQFTENSDIADQIYAGFTATHPNVTIERETFTLEQLRTTASTALASGTGPDVIYHDVTPGREFYRSGLVLSLDEYAEEYGWRERFYPAGLRWTLVDDTLTGLGLEYEFVGVFYNKTRMDEAGLQIPETLEQTLEYCRQASEAGFIPYVAATGAGWPNYFYFTMPLHNTVGVQQMTDLLFGGQGTWDSPEVVSAIEVFYRQMRDAGCFPENPNAVDFDIGRDLLWAGDALAMPIGTWLIPDVAQFDPEHEYVMSPFPAIDGNPRVYTAGMGSAFFISSQSAHPDVAAEFLDYLFSDEATRIWVEQAQYIPPVPVDTEGLDVPPLFQFALETLTAAGSGEGGTELGYNIDLLVPQEFNTMMEDGFQAVMADEKTPEQQAADLQQIWENRDQ
jgi:raffinose/stachyose/melibiose transport system substrate-binding protein